MMKITDLEHQNRVCQALVEYLKKRKARDLKIIGIPDQLDKHNPAVDLWFKDPTGQEYVLEHTLIESFPEEICDRNTFEQVFLPLEKELEGELPGPARYQLDVPADELENGRKHETARGSLKSWIRSKAVELQQKSERESSADRGEENKRVLSGGDLMITGEVPGVSRELRLRIRNDREGSGGSGGSLSVRRRLPENLSVKRKERLEKALDDKCPKLKEARGEDRTSILLLEMMENNITDHRETAAVLSELLPAREDKPDEIYLIQTGVDPWKAYLLKEGESFFPGIEDPGPHQL